MVQWITLFDHPDDDVYDGTLCEDDEEIPRVKIEFIVEEIDNNISSIVHKKSSTTDSIIVNNNNNTSIVSVRNSNKNLKTNTGLSNASLTQANTLAVNNNNALRS